MVPEHGAVWKRAAVTGGAGFIGTRRCRRLIAAGTSVVRVDNCFTSSPDGLQTLRADPRFTLVEADTAGQALRGLPLTVVGDGSQTRSLCNVDDTVRAVLPLARDARGGQPEISWREGLTETLAWFSAQRQAGPRARVGA